MRRTVKVLVLVWVLIAAGTASAVSLSTRFPQFADELQARLDRIPATRLTKPEKKQKAAIRKALAALATDSAEISKSIRSAKKAIAATDGAFPGDATLDGLELGVVSAFASDVLDRNAQLLQSIQTLAEGTAARTRAQAKRDDAGADLAASQAASGHAQQLTLIGSAVTAIAAGEKIVKKAGGSIVTNGDVTVTAVEADIGTAANRLHVPAASEPFGTYVVIYESSLDRLMLTVEGRVNNQTVAFILAIPGHGTGTREVPILGPSMFSSPGVTPPPATAIAGSATFTTWDLESHKIAGTFDATYSNGITTIHVMNGVFSTLDLKVP